MSSNKYQVSVKSRLSLILLVVIFNLFACTETFQKEISISCTESGTIGADKVPHPTQGFDISFQYYLPPCYDDLKNSYFPVIYLIAMPSELRLDQDAHSPMSLTDRLIRDRKLAPVILVVPDPTVGYGYHAALAIDLIPFVDKKLNTLTDRRYRGVGGISHGAAIAARMAFQFPDVFGSLGVFSGGIDASEKPTFDTWIDSTSPENLPRVLINIGDQDGIMPYTQNLTSVLDSWDVPYELNIDPGGHNWVFWSAHMESYLLWFAEAWE